MPARSIGSGTISFGLVSIPIRVYVATHSEQLSFNMLHASCGTRIKQRMRLCAFPKWARFRSYRLCPWRDRRTRPPVCNFGLAGVPEREGASCRRPGLSIPIRGT